MGAPMGSINRTPTILFSGQIMKKIKIFIYVFIAGICVFSCSRPSKTEKAGVSPDRAGKIPYSDRSSLTDDQKGLVIARIGDDVLTLGELDAKLLNEPSYVRMRYNSPERKLEYLKSMVEFEILAMEAMKKGMDKDPKVMQVLKEEMSKQYEKQVLDGLVSISEVKEEEMKKYYDQNMHMYVRPDQKRISHILIRDREKAEKILADLKTTMNSNPAQKRKIFMEKVEEFSEDAKTKQTNGDLGFIPADEKSGGEPEVSTAISQAAEKLREQFETSDLIEDSDGFHILFVVLIKTGLNRPFDEVKTSIQERLFRKMKLDAKKNYVEKLIRDAKVEIYEDSLKLIKESAPQPLQDAVSPADAQNEQVNAPQINLPDIRKSILTKPGRPSFFKRMDGKTIKIPEQAKGNEKK
jgi:parvulin-like peptidyl-prolyl isomerase